MRLRELAASVDHVTEFGTRYGNSSAAFLRGLYDRPGGGTLVSYDINMTLAPEVQLPLGLIWEKRQCSTIEEGMSIAETDLLFLDSCHDYGHVIQELNRHADKARRFIAMHDVAPNWSGAGHGPFRALGEFLDKGAPWRVLEFHQNCNGLAILQRA